jgi:hypothetical protein
VVSLSNHEWLHAQFAGGCPAASHFLLLRQKESNQRKGAPGLPPLRGSLDISPASGAAQLALAGHTHRAPLRSSNSARLNLRLLAKYRGGAQGMEKRKSKPYGGQQVAHHSQNNSAPVHWSASRGIFVMDLDKFLNLIATIIGALGAIYVMFGILSMSPDLMGRLSQSYWGFSVPQIEALAEQKADSIAGVTYVVIAFILTSVTIIFVPEGVRIFENKVVALALAAVLTGGLFITLHFVGKGIYRNQKVAVGKIFTTKYLEDIAKRGRLELSDKESLTAYARNLLDLDMLPNESVQSLLPRMAMSVGITLPENLDYSAFKPK